MASKTYYREEAESDALDCVQEFAEQIVEQIIESQAVSDDALNDLAGFDSYHHETHVDKEYDLKAAADLIDELHYYEETDDGLWDGQGPRRAISIQAACTYGNAVIQMFMEHLKELNDDDDLMALGEAYSRLNDMTEDEHVKKLKAAVKDEIARRIKEFVDGKR